MANEAVFEIEYKGGKIKVQRHRMGGYTTVFRIGFSNGRSPLVITRATGEHIGRHWTSIPEGRLSEAQEIGPLIEQYYQEP
jgi:hypothetical protein